MQYFSEVRSREVVAGDAGETPPAVAEGGAVATNYVLFVDDDHTQEAFRRQVLYGFRDSLDGLPTQDRIAVVVQSRNRLELLGPFTRDREETRAALEELDRGGRFGGVAQIDDLSFIGATGAGGSSSLATGASLELVPGATGEPDALRECRDIRADRPFDPADRQIDAALDRLSAAGFDTVADRLSAAGMSLIEMTPRCLVDDAMASILERDLTLSVNAVTSAMRALEQPEGRSVLLLLAGRWPTGEIRVGRSGAELGTELDLLDGLIDTANLLGYTVYPMDQQGGLPSVRWWGNLRYIARETGGVAFMAGSNLDALERVSRDTSSYYWLGFVPEYRRDDRVHDIEVDVLRPGLRVRARRGYVDLSRSAQADIEVQRTLLFPPQKEPAAAVLKAWVGAPRKLGRRMMAVPIDLEVPLGMFAALPYGAEYVQRLEVRFATIDDAGWRAEQAAIPLDVRSDSAPDPGAVFDYYTEVTLRREPHVVVVTVHDPVSRQTVSARVEVAP